MNDPKSLYEAANRASADAIRFRRDPSGGPMARLRAQDAKALRRLARSAAQADPATVRLG